MTMVLLSTLFIAVAMLLMGIGLLFGRGCLTRACGGALFETARGSVRCPWCPKRNVTEAGTRG